MSSARASRCSSNVADLDKAADGQRLAAYLGIDPEFFATCPNAGRFDHAEAVAMNTALFPGTIGYFLRTMIAEVGRARRRSSASANSSSATSADAARSRDQRRPPALRHRPRERLPARARRRRSAAREPDFIGGTEHCVATLRDIWRRLPRQLPRIGRTERAAPTSWACWPASDVGRILPAHRLHLRFPANLAGFRTGGDRMDDVFAMVFEGIAARSAS